MTRQPLRLHLIVTALMVLATLVGCSDDAGVEVVCETPSSDLVQVLADSLTISGQGSIRNAQAVKSDDFNNVWMVAAEIDGPGLEDNGDIAVWGTNNIHSLSLTMAADSVARAFSDIAPDNDQFRSTDHGVREAKDCVRSLQ